MVKPFGGLLLGAALAFPVVPVGCQNDDGSGHIGSTATKDGGADGAAGGGGAAPRGACVDGRLAGDFGSKAMNCPCVATACGKGVESPCRDPESFQLIGKSVCLGPEWGNGMCDTKIEGKKCYPGTCDDCDDCCSACLCAQNNNQAACLEACNMICDVPTKCWSKGDCATAFTPSDAGCADCACTHCACEMQACRDTPGCLEVLDCVQRTGCWKVGACETPCSAEIKNHGDINACPVVFAMKAAGCAGQPCGCVK